MISKFSFKHLLKALTGSAICGVTLIASPSAVEAATCASNPSSLSSNCTVTPESYVITVYEMGLCTSDPLSSTDFDGTSCSATLTSAGGIEADIAGTTTDLSGGTPTRPSDGTYEYAYIKMSNSFGVKGSYELNSTTYYSDSSGGATGSSATSFTSTLVDFDGGRTCTGSPTYSDTGTLTLGVFKARIATTSYTTATSCSSSTSKRIVGSFKFNTPVTIEDTTSGLQVTLKSTGTGMTVIPDSGSGTTVDSFDGGPFEPEFETF